MSLKRILPATVPPGAARGALVATGALLFACFLFLLYRPSLSGGFYLDSKAYVRNTHFFQGGTTMAAAVKRAVEPGYNPAGRRILPNLTIAMQSYRSGPDAAALRLGNVALHGLNVLLVFLTVHALTPLLLPGLRSRGQVSCALLTAAFWGLNPFLVDTVAYTVQRYVLMETAFFLAAVIVFLRLDPADDLRRRMAAGAGVLLCLTAALLSKEVALLFPLLAIILVGYVPALWKKWRGTTDLYVLPALTLALTAAVLLALKGSQPLVMGLPDDLPFNTLERILTESRVVLHQLSLFLWPLADRMTLTPYYEISRGILAPPATAAAVALLASLTIGALLLRRRLLVFGTALLWYLTLHLAESTGWRLHLAFPHRSYLPTVLAALPLAAGLVVLAGRLNRAGKLALSAAVLALLVFLSRGTLLRAGAWGDEERFWLEAIATAPKATGPYVSLSGFYLEHDRPATAAAVAERGLKESSLEETTRRTAASLEVNHGIALAQLGRLEEGVAALEKAVALQPRDPDYSYNLAFYLARAGRRDEAKAVYRTIIAAQPSYPDAHLQLASLLIPEGRYEEALRLVEEELRYFPANKRALWTRQYLIKAGAGGR